MTQEQFISFVKKPIVIVSFLLTVCLIFLAYWFGWKTLENNIYQKGVSAIIYDFSSQYITNGTIQIPIIVNDEGTPDITGTKTATGIFILQSNN
jgi:hypothetical protein